jgi:mannose-6-phosphate isomerase-like protein (cupin superfamily)
MDEIKFPRIFAIDIDNLETEKRDHDHIWGDEAWLVNDRKLNIGCKFLTIFPGFTSSKHKHLTKSEYFIVLAGELKLREWNPGGHHHEVVLEQGRRYFIPKNIYHRFETGSKQFVLLLEVSTFEDEQTEKELKSERLY